MNKLVSAPSSFIDNNFNSALDNGYFYLKDYTFISENLVDGLDIVIKFQTSGTRAIPLNSSPISFIERYKDTDGKFPIQSSIAFSTETGNNPGRVIFKRQLFPEDLKKNPSSGSNSTTGVYIKGFDQWIKLLPSPVSASSFREYNMTGDVDSKKLMMDGGWFIINNQKMGGTFGYADRDCYERNPGFKVSNIACRDNNIFFKSIREKDDDFGIYAIDINRSLGEWTSVKQRKCYKGRHYITVVKDGDKIDNSANKFYTSTKNIDLPTDAIKFSFSDNNIQFWDNLDNNNTWVPIKWTNECNFYFIHADKNLGNDSYAGPETDNKFKLIQPSLRYIIKTLMDDDTTGLAMNICIKANGADDFTSSTVTNNFLQIELSEMSQSPCDSRMQSFCGSNDITTGITNLTLPVCKQFCKRFNCIGLLQNYCQTEYDKNNPNFFSEEPTRSICGCVIDVPAIGEALINYKKDASKKGINLPDCGPHAIFPPCIIAKDTGYLVYQQKTNPTEDEYRCKQAVTNCVRYVEINNKGNIGGVNVEQGGDSKCQGFIKTDGTKDDSKDDEKDTDNTDTKAESPGLSTTAKIGIGVGVFLLIIIIIVGMYFAFRSSPQVGYGTGYGTGYRLPYGGRTQPGFQQPSFQQPLYSNISQGTN
jgi:hypothetical protein